MPVIVVGSTLPGCSGGESTDVPRLIIENVTVISPETSAQRGVSVSIVGERIDAIGVDLEPGAADSVIAGNGRFLIPGLIDGHVHLEVPVGLPLPVPPELTEAAARYFEQLPRSYLFHGFTTVVNLGVVDPAALERFAASPVHPDVHHCGPALPIKNGYPITTVPPDFGAEVFPNFLADPQQTRPGTPPDTVDRSPRAAVERVVEAGGICAKTFHEDGFGDQPIWPVPSAQILNALREETRARDIPLVIHANSYSAWKAASDVPASIIAHAMWNWDGEAASVSEDLPASIRAVLDSVLARDIAFMPTLRVIEGLRDLYDPGFLADPRLTRVLPGPVIEWYRTPAAGGYARELADGRSPESMRRNMEGGVKAAALVTRYLVQRGGRIVFGSDTPSGPTYANPPGLNGYIELSRLAAAGIPLDRLLAAATVETARAFQLDSLYGTIEPGKVANLLLLARNPLETVEA